MNVYVKSIDPGDEYAEIPEIKAEVYFDDEEDDEIIVPVTIPKDDSLNLTQLKAEIVAAAYKRLRDALASPKQTS